MLATCRRIGVPAICFVSLTWFVGSGASSQVPSTEPQPKPKQAKQDATIPHLQELREQGRIHFSVPAPVVVETDTRCDQHGNIYLVYSDNGRENLSTLPIRRLSPDSRSVLSYALEPSPGCATEPRFSWDVSPSGTVWSLRACYHHLPPQDRELPDYLIERFKDDGTVDSVTEVEQPKQGFVRAERLAAFPDGGFLITGILVPDPAHQELMRPFTGVYRQNGQLFREVEVTDFVRIPAGGEHPAGGSGQEAGAKREISQALWAGVRGKLVAAPDGNVYSLRATTPPVLYKISPGGELLKEIKIQLDLSGLNPMAFSLPMTGGAFIVFDRMPTGNPTEDAKSTPLPALIDLETGAVTGAFRLPSQGRVMTCGCLTPQGEFLFVGASDTGKLDLVRFASN